MPIVADQFERFEGMPPLPWLSPTKMAVFKAGKLQQGVRHDEKRGMDEYSSDEIGIATVHARQDIILVYSMLVDLHRQQVNISRGVWLLVAFAAVALWHYG